MTIGVFDSGVGGLTVLSALRKAFPKADLLYLGDTARVPYGSRSAETVARYATDCARWLLDRGCEQLVIACNTASAYGSEAVVELAKGRPVYGVVRAGAQAAQRGAAPRASLCSPRAGPFRRRRIIARCMRRRRGPLCVRLPAPYLRR